MWPIWKGFPTWWNHLMQVLLLAVVLCISACTAPGHSRSTPSALSPEGGSAGPQEVGKDAGGY
jgi:hypothetical protein